MGNLPAARSARGITTHRGAAGGGRSRRLTPSFWRSALEPSGESRSGRLGAGCDHGRIADGRGSGRGNQRDRPHDAWWHDSGRDVAWSGRRGTWGADRHRPGSDTNGRAHDTSDRPTDAAADEGSDASTDTGADPRADARADPGADP